MAGAAVNRRFFSGIVGYLHLQKKTTQFNQWDVYLFLGQAVTNFTRADE